MHGGPNPGAVDLFELRGDERPCALAGRGTLVFSRPDWAEGRSSRREHLSMECQDKMLKCIDCGAAFVFTAGEQLFLHDKQFKNEPKRCKACKTKRVAV